MKIVIVEDEKCIREGIKKILNRMSAKYEILGEAENGKEGMSLIREVMPDVVITDVKMPYMDGLEMIKQIVAENISVQIIVISAYSEFEYARGAMKLGVTEYLLKPIGLAELLQSMENVEIKLLKEKQKKPEGIGTLEHVLRDFMEGTMKLEDEIETYLFNKYKLTPDTPVMIVCAYLGRDYKEKAKKAKRKLEYIFSLKDVSVSIFSLQERRSVIVILYNFADAAEIERYLQRQLLYEEKTEMVCGCTTVSSVMDLQMGFQKLYPYMDWNISFQNEVLISYPKIMKVQTVPCIYPIEVEAKCKASICSNEWEKVKEYFDEFEKKFSDGKLYEPKEIKECYVRFIWSMLGISKEIGVLKQEQVETQMLLETIITAKRKDELSKVLDDLLHAMMVKQDSGITHLTVKRVLNMIHEFYQARITLEQISEKLNMTPEYIGTQFHKEVGVTFSTYIRNYRVSKAKEMLCGTDLKIYEIAEKVGYTDSKYFSKIFKEVTGQLPAEYRKTHT